MQTTKSSLQYLVFLLLFVVGAGLIFSQPVRAQTPEPQQRVVIYMFWGDGCPHCAEAKPYFAALAKKYPQIDLRLYEVWYNAQNQEMFTEMAKRAGFEASGVPTIFIGPYHLVGYGAQKNADIEAAITYCIQNGCPDAGQALLPTVGVTKAAQPQKTATPTALPAASGKPSSGELPQSHVIAVPFVGAIDLDAQSLTISTLLIAFVDGVNPCSIWVLTMLLALTLHSGSRKKVVLIGLVFLTVTAGIYALFIAGLFSILKIVSFIGWVQVAVALVALFFGLVNVKDYFWYKEGISFTIADEKKPGIYKQMRGLLNASQSTPSLIGATIVLAAGVSLIEFSCTAGFPVIWTNLLNAQGVSTLTFILLLLLYLLIYQLDELVIFFVAVFTMKSSRMEEKGGRILKLIGGTLMLALAVVMLINPAIMNDISSSLVVFAIAFGAAGLVLLLHRVILPKFGVWIGTEKG
jgi:thiol-disulfide isomerase/thioredoxin